MRWGYGGYGLAVDVESGYGDQKSGVGYSPRELNLYRYSSIGNSTIRDCIISAVGTRSQLTIRAYWLHSPTTTDRSTLLNDCNDNYCYYYARDTIFRSAASKYQELIILRHNV